jgi:hypothetical protein
MPEADFLLELVMIGDEPAQLFQARKRFADNLTT